MMIAIHAGATLAEYAQQYAAVAARRPERCPACGAVSHMIGHSCYPRRKPLDATPAPLRPVPVRRWRCTVCKVTTSVLPDLFHRHRHYQWAVIGAALIRRFVLGQTWAQIQAALSQMPAEVDPAPSLDSLQRWCKAYAAQAQTWLQSALVVLATVWPQWAGFNAHGNTGDKPPPTQLLHVMAILAQWLAPAHGALEGTAPPNVEAIRTVWRWGWNQGLGRLT
jgi:hypothetical protein